MTDTPEKVYPKLTHEEMVNLSEVFGLQVKSIPGIEKVLKPRPDLKLKNLVAKGWSETYAELFGRAFVDVLAPHHVESIAWHWESRLAFLEHRRPDYLAYFPIFSRGHMKSTLAERMVVIDAMLSVAYQQPGYALLCARNKDKVQEHIANIETLLASATVRKYCPQLSTPKRTEITNQQRRWTSSFLKTEANYSV